MQDIFHSDTTLLKRFASFLKENHLEELTKEYLKIIRRMNIPLMKLFEDLPEEQLLQLAQKGMNDFLTSLENDTTYEVNAESLRKWENDELEQGIPKEAIQPSDIVLISGAQQLAITNFIPQFSSNSEDALAIMKPLSAYFMKSQEKANEVLFRIRDEAETKLKESEERFRAVAQSAVDAIIIANMEGEILFWNTGAEKMFCYSEKEALAKNIKHLLPDPYEELYLHDIKHYLKTGESKFIGKTSEITANRKDDSQFPIEISLSTFESKGGRLLSAIIHDITPSKMATQKLEQNAEQMAASNAELEQFAYIASHDLKEPLRMVTNYLQLLHRKLIDELDTESKEYIEYALNGALRMRVLITDLLEFSRVNRADRVMEKVDFNKILEEVLTNLDAQISEKRAKITFGDMPVLCSDHLQMVQLFQNLISNAIKFSSEEAPVVHVGVDKLGDEWLFCVKDNGIGIDPKFNDKIFLMFQRLHSKEEYPGTGIGLAICKKIVERFGGKIWFESQVDIDSGTTFFFTLKEDITEPGLINNNQLTANSASGEKGVEGKV